MAFKRENQSEIVSEGFYFLTGYVVSKNIEVSVELNENIFLVFGH